MSTFKDRLREAAKHADIAWSQTAIADSLGIKKQTVDRWFEGYTPRMEMVFHIADTWGVDIRWLATGNGAMIAKRRKGSATGIMFNSEGSLAAPKPARRASVLPKPLEAVAA